MIPQIIQLGPIPINSFGLMVALGILAAIYLLTESFRANGLNPNLAEKYALAGGLVGVLGAKLWYIFVDAYENPMEDFVSALFSSGGFTFYGGFILGTLTLLIMSRLDKIPLNKFADSFGPCLTISYAIGRLGCQLAGDGDYGISTESFLGMSYATGVVPTAPGVLAFPTPLYESILCFIILYVLLKAEKNPKWNSVPYRRFGLYLILIGLERFTVEFIRINPDIVGILSQAQIIALVIIFIGGSLIAAQSVGFIRNAK